MVNRETIKLAFQALAAHKLRSFLTLLGVIIGVASVIAVVSVIQGLNQYMTDQISQFGTTTFSVNKFSSGFKNFQDFLKENKRPNITMDDFEAITAGCVHCQYTGAVYGQGANLVKYKGFEAESVGVRGVSVNEPFMGEVMDVGSGNETLQRGDRVVVPFTIACGNCFFCRNQMWSLCDNSNPNAGMLEKMYGQSTAGLFGYSHLFGGYAGGQAEYVRVPYGDVGPMKIPDSMDDERAVSLRHLSHRI